MLPCGETTAIKERSAWSEQIWREEVGMRAGEMAKAVLTDSHFWIPAVVLLGGVVLLVVLH